MNERQQLEVAIAALEAQRRLVGDVATDAALSPMRVRLAGFVEHEQSLRQVTVLFMDVVGSTALSRQLDAEEIHEIIDGALRRLTAIVEHNQGRVLQYAGDSLLAVFGASQAREDDPERAVRCALSIVREAQQIGAEVRASTHQGDFNVRVGIHTGSVLLGGGVDEASTIRGITVNIAARMEQTAPVGGVRISHETQRHVRGIFDLTDEPPITVKGFSEPMRSHLVVRERSRSVATLGRGIEGVVTPMIGRDAELKALIEAFETVREDDSLLLVTVAGDPGLGKTRLMDEFERWLERDHAAAVRIHARAQPYSNSAPYGLLRDLLTWHFEILDSDSQELAQAKLTRGFATQFGEGAAEQAAAVGRLIGLDYSANDQITAIEGEGRAVRDRAFQALAHYLRRLKAGSSTPVVLLLDDLHWADDGSLDFIQHIARACQDVPILVLGVTRPALFDRRPLWSSGRREHLRLELLPLSRRGSRELADALLSRMHTVPAALRDLVTSSAEGNPYFVEELVSMLIDDGVIVAEEGHWRVVPDRLLQVRVPSTLAGVLQARLDALPPQELAVLQHASVIGHVFWDEALQQIAPVAPQVLGGLMRRDLACGRDASTFEGTHEFTFKHHLLHQVTYDTVLKRNKWEQHRLTAQWLVSRSGERASEYSGLIADHFEKAGDVELAVTYLKRAAAHARRAYSIDTALAFFDRALAQMPDSADRFDTLLQRSLATFETGDEVAQDSNVAALEQLAERLDDDGRRAVAASFRTSYAASSNDLAVAEASATKALIYAESSGNQPAAIRAHNQLGYALATAGAFARAQQHADQGLLLARASENWSGEASALNLIGYIAQELGQYSAARGHRRAAISVVQSHDDPVWENFLLGQLARNELEIGHYAFATKQLHVAREVFRATGPRDYLLFNASQLAYAAYLRGEFHEALDWVFEAGTVGSEHANRCHQAELLMVSGEVHDSLGASTKARSCYEQSLANYRAIKMPVAALAPQAGLARLALASGEIVQAKVHLSDVIERIAAGWRTGMALNPFRIMLTCYEVLSASGDAQAKEILDMAYTMLHERAALLEGDDKEAYLGGVATHRAITAAWGSLR